MKTIDKYNPYGYRIGYRENGSRFFEDYFLTYTYPDAVKMRQHSLTYPPIYSHDDGHLLINPSWEIRLITLQQLLAGIWQQNPF